MVHKLKKIISFILLYPLWLVVKRHKNRELIQQDMLVWLNVNQKQVVFTIGSFVWLMRRCNAYRNLLYYRIGQINFLYLLIYRPLNSLYIYTPKIGGGLYIEHGFSTIISANSIGENCWINQQVTIGYSNLPDAPIIENNVRISAGAKIIGDITIGANSKIGAGTVVVKNVPANCTVVGSESYIVRLNGSKVNRVPLQ